MCANSPTRPPFFFVCDQHQKVISHRHELLINGRRNITYIIVYTLKRYSTKRQQKYEARMRHTRQH